MFEKVVIYGLGLIGSSVARAVMHYNLAKHVHAVDLDPDVCEKVLELGIAHTTSTNLTDGLKGADFIMVAVPVGKIGSVIEKILPFVEEEAIITDAGSVKAPVADLVKRLKPRDRYIIPGHPIAGTENSGPEAGFIELFHERWVILTPDPDTPIKAIEKLTLFWEACGSQVEMMDARHHDLVLGITSHLPHLIAYSIVGTANELEDDIKSEVIKYSASGFRDFTRIAASDPIMWRDIFINNKEAILEIIQRFSEDLTALQKAIRRDDGDTLFKKFTETREIRRSIIDMGQANYVYPSQSQAGTPPVEPQSE